MSSVLSASLPAGRFLLPLEMHLAPVCCCSSSLVAIARRLAAGGEFSGVWKATAGCCCPVPPRSSWLLRRTFRTPLPWRPEVWCAGTAETVVCACWPPGQACRLMGVASSPCKPSDTPILSLSLPGGPGSLRPLSEAAMPAAAPEGVGIAVLPSVGLVNTTGGVGKGRADMACSSTSSSSSSAQPAASPAFSMPAAGSVVGFLHSVCMVSGCACRGCCGALWARCHTASRWPAVKQGSSGEAGILELSPVSGFPISTGWPQPVECWPVAAARQAARWEVSAASLRSMRATACSMSCSEVCILSSMVRSSL
mmetsp:Transcript_35321/g.100000  ORF Transcript_35321/g.100000 Transcript_35321/m.100000 type:complete len:310 (-) Transcript_35321:387-1316(-)